MNDEYRPLLHKLVECLESASQCIEQVPDRNEFKSVAIQLRSLKLILDGNAEALRVWMEEGDSYSRFQSKLGPVLAKREG